MVSSGPPYAAAMADICGCSEAAAVSNFPAALLANSSRSCFCNFSETFLESGKTASLPHLDQLSQRVASDRQSSSDKDEESRTRGTISCFGPAVSAAVSNAVQFFVTPVEAMCPPKQCHNSDAPGHAYSNQ
ncbi:hypothetical protein J6590_094229 [Homalodisca vitripennis]|nr:hypothetical protein J6590_094229 [Homalodisca vitripennis]